MTGKCLCGAKATATVYLPVGNVYSGLEVITEPHAVCDYHANKAREQGFKVVPD